MCFQPAVLGGTNVFPCNRFPSYEGEAVLQRISLYMPFYWLECRAGSVALWNMVLVDRQSLDACDLVHIVGRESGVPRRRVALERFTRGNCPVLL